MHVFIICANAVGLMAIFGVLYGVIENRPWTLQVRTALIGVMFGFGTIYAMSTSFSPVPGVIADPRNIFIGFSAAFGGPVSVAITLAIGVFKRASIGGAGMDAGIVSMTIAACMGLFWRRLVASRVTRRVPCFLLLGVLISCSIVSLLLLPAPVALSLLTNASPYIVGMNLIGALILGTFIERERITAMKMRQLRQEAEIDALTGLLNRRSLEASFERLRAASSVGKMAFLLMDIDFFKRVNDRYGHDAGDAVLKESAVIMRDCVRQQDLVGRLGGEEFGIVMPNTSTAQALAVAERLRTAVERKRSWCVPGPDSLTTSIGIYAGSCDEGFQTFYSRADFGLYDAKRSGRNKVVLHEETQVPGKVRALSAVRSEAHPT